MSLINISSILDTEINSDDILALIPNENLMGEIEYRSNLDFWKEFISEYSSYDTKNLIQLALNDNNEEDGRED